MKTRSKYGYIIYKITADKKFIEVRAPRPLARTHAPPPPPRARRASVRTHTSAPPQLPAQIEHKGEKGASFSDFSSKLPDDECRYGVLDVEINTKSGATANKLIFIAWSDDNASVKPKMLYASSKDALKKSIEGINEEYQATDRSDLDYAEIKKKAGSV